MVQLIADFKPAMVCIVEVESTGTDHAIRGQQRDRPANAGLLSMNSIRPFDDRPDFAVAWHGLEVDQVTHNLRTVPDFGPGRKIASYDSPQPQPLGT